MGISRSRIFCRTHPSARFPSSAICSRRGAITGLCSDCPNSRFRCCADQVAGDGSPTAEEIWMRDDVGGGARVQEGKWRFVWVGELQARYDATKLDQLTCRHAVSALWITKQKHRLLYGIARRCLRLGMVTLWDLAARRTLPRCDFVWLSQSIRGSQIWCSNGRFPEAACQVLECQFIPLLAVSPTASSTY